MIRLFVPGRLCLFGEHSDWAGALRSADASISPGACILSGTNQGLHAAVSASTSFEMVSQLPSGARVGPISIAMEDEALLAATRGRDFFSYAAGVAAEVHRRYGTSGVRIEIGRTDLPIARGLSSSAAVAVLTARAFNRVHRLGLDLRAEMDLAYHGEIATGSQCGRMDQACAYGREVVELGFDGEAMRIGLVSIGAPLHMIIVDLRHEKDTRRILADLNGVFRSREDPRCEPLRAALGTHNLAIVANALRALRSGDGQALGRLMAQAQALFDRDVAPACPTELAAPRLHALLSDVQVQALTWGGKGVGSQGDGAAQLVCRDVAAQRQLLATLSQRLPVDCLALTLGDTQPSDAS